MIRLCRNHVWLFLLLAIVFARHDARATIWDNYTNLKTAGIITSETGPKGNACNGGVQVTSFASVGDPDTTPSSDPNTIACRGLGGKEKLRPGSIGLTPCLARQVGAKAGDKICSGGQYLGSYDDSPGGTIHIDPSTGACTTTYKHNGTYHIYNERIDVYNYTFNRQFPGGCIQASTLSVCGTNNAQICQGGGSCCDQNPPTTPGFNTTPKVGSPTPPTPPATPTAPAVPPPPPPPAPGLGVISLPGFGATALTTEGTAHPPNPDPQMPIDTTPSYIGCGSCSCIMTAATAQRALIKSEAEATRTLLDEQFAQYQTWLVNDFFELYIRPTMMQMTQMLSAVGMEQVMIFGGFLDARQQIAVQTTINSMAADAHREFQPTPDMCAIGTAVRGMGAAYRNAEFVADLMSQRSQARQMGQQNTASGEGMDADRVSRLSQFKSTYCSADDGNGMFASLCDNGSGQQGPSPDGTPLAAVTSAARINKDIDFTRTLDQADTLNIDFSDPTDTPDKQDVMALESNLFAHTVLDRMSDSLLGMGNNQAPYLETRSLMAKRSVAENSFFNAVGMKAAGTAASADTGAFIKVFMQEMGVTNQDDIKQILGDKPSYYALLDILGQKIYQNPQFFVNLYDTPDNVARKDVAMQAIGLMMDRDTYKSELRSEADLAVLLEMELDKSQREAQDWLTWVNSDGKMAQ